MLHGESVILIIVKHQATRINLVVRGLDKLHEVIGSNPIADNVNQENNYSKTSYIERMNSNIYNGIRTFTFFFFSKPQVYEIHWTPN